MIDIQNTDSLFKKPLNEILVNNTGEQFNGFASNPLLDEDDNILLEEN